MALDLNITKEIVERLKPLDPKKIILFGSLAYGVSDKDGDIDLYVVTKDEFIPNSWREHSEIFLQYVTAIPGGLFLIKLLNLNLAQLDIN